MKLITLDIDYAARALMYLASEKDSAVLHARNIAACLKVPGPYLRKILQALNKNGLLISTKGRGGGFSLARDPADISIFDIIDIFQGAFELKECIIRDKVCDMVSSCELKRRTDAIEANLTRELKAITIASLVKKDFRFKGKNK